MMFTYSPFSAEAHDDPYPLYRTLRDELPAYHNEEYGFWALSRYEDVQAAARDWRTFTSIHGQDLDGLGDIFGPGHFIDDHPPDHDRLRNVLRQRFSPRGVQILEGKVRTAVRETLSECIERGEADLAAEFAWPLPVVMISHLLGLPSTDRPLLEEWATLLSLRTPDEPAIPPTAIEATRQLREYFGEVLRFRRKKRGDDVLSDIVSAERRGEIRTDEIMGMCYLLFLAGTETTGSLLANAVALLDQFPDQREFLRADSSRIPTAIEEMLRYEAPVQVLGRVTTQAVVRYEEVIPEGSRVLLIFGSANRDGRRFDEPDRLDLERQISRHLGFGDGIHFCLGAPLARLEARVALEEILVRAPNYAVSGPVTRRHMHTTRGLESVPVKFDHL